MAGSPNGISSVLLAWPCHKQIVTVWCKLIYRVDPLLLWSFFFVETQPEWKEAFSSFESKVPIVMQKTFIFPHPVTALGVAVTQRGITAKDILVGTALGQVSPLVAWLEFVLSTTLRQCVGIVFS